MEPVIQNKALPYRRENFFRLLDIHFRNLEAICYEEQVFNPQTKKYDKERWQGREAVYQRYALLTRYYKGKGQDNLETIKAVFGDFFLHEVGIYEVYLNHIKHMANYIQEAEIDQYFFLNTLLAVLSRYELAMLFYYTISDIDPAFREFAAQSSVFGESLGKYLINEKHLSLL